MCGCWQSEGNSLTLSRRIVYGLGHILNELTAAMWFTYLLVFMHYVVGFSNNIAGYLMLIGQITDAVATPLFGFAMDRTRGLCGYSKRKSWHIIGALSVVVSFPFVFMPCLLGDLVGLWGRFGYYVAFIVVFQLGYLSIQISHLSLIPALTSNKAERTELNAIRYGFTVVATIVLYLITWLLLGMTEDSHDVTEEDMPVFRTLALVIVGVGFFFVIVFHLIIKEPGSTSLGNHLMGKSEVNHERIPACKKESAPTEDKTKPDDAVQVGNGEIPGPWEATVPSDSEAKVEAEWQREQDEGQHEKKPSAHLLRQMEPSTKEAPKMTVAEMSVPSASQVTPSGESLVNCRERQTTQQAPSNLESQTSMISCSIRKDVVSKIRHQHELDDGDNAHDCTFILQSETGISGIHSLTITDEIAHCDGTDENGVTGARHGSDDDDSVRPVSEDVMTHATISRMRTDMVSSQKDAAVVSPPATDDCDMLVTCDDVTTVTWRDAKTSKMMAVKTAAGSYNMGQESDGQPQALCILDVSNNNTRKRIEDDKPIDPNQAVVVCQDVSGMTSIPWKQWFREYQFYQIAVLYMCGRLVVNISQVYLPFYLSDSIMMDKKYIAIIPLVLYISGFISSLIQRPINMYCGRKVIYFCAGLVTLAACIWFRLLHHSHEMLVFGAACLMGLGGSTLLVTSLALITDLIGQYVDSSSFVFGSMTFAEKLVTGVAIFAIQELHPCPADVCCDACVPYYRDILTYVTGVMAIVGLLTLLTLGSAVIGQLRLHKKE